MKEQVVVRTNHAGMFPTRDLSEKLQEGYTVVMCNPIGDYLEYILEKGDL